VNFVKIEMCEKLHCQRATVMHFQNRKPWRSRGLDRYANLNLNLERKLSNV